MKNKLLVADILKSAKKHKACANPRYGVLRDGLVNCNATDKREKDMESIRIKNENCTLAGCECGCLADERRGEEGPCGDCSEYDVSQEEVDALRKRAKSAGAGTDRYLLKVADTIAERLSWM